jgi:hypothetical protein
MAITCQGLPGKEKTKQFSLLLSGWVTPAVLNNDLPAQM